ncbi:MAG: chromosomal replication initiator protein DnaA [Oxalobacter sp.]
MESFWQNCLSRLALEVTPQQYTTWIKPLVLVDCRDGLLHIAAPNFIKREWVKQEFASRIAELASKILGRSVEVQVSVAKKKNSVGATVAQQPESAPLTTPSASPVNELPLKQDIQDNPVQQQNHLDAGINPEMTFDSFVMGKANQLARAAAIQIANNPGTSYNPLYLFGGVGLGKTHLIQAIGNQVLKERPSAKIRYIHAEQYVRDVVSAYQRQDFDGFKRNYHSLDMLLIDDIQFFAGKNRTQEEFFYAFEALIAARKQIIITSDTYPQDIAGLESRLTSRFASGLTVAIEPPELEMRVAILFKKATQIGVSLNDDVAFFIANLRQSNVRELEGALSTVVAHSKFMNQEITIDLAKEVLKSTGPSNLVSVESIQKAVADYYRIKVADMYSKRRPANIARPRQIAMYLAKELTQKSLPEIGEQFGGRDHTTVLHAVRKIAQERQKNAELNHELHVLEQTVKR